jgi:hypothetical protein
MKRALIENGNIAPSNMFLKFKNGGVGSSIFWVLTLFYTEKSFQTSIKYQQHNFLLTPNKFIKFKYMMEDLADGIKTKSLTNALELLTEQVRYGPFFVVVTSE